MCNVWIPTEEELKELEQEIKDERNREYLQEYEDSREEEE